MRDVVEILVHWHAGRRMGELSSSLGADPKTIRKYTAPAVAAGIVPGSPPLSLDQWSALASKWFPELVDHSYRQSSWAEIEQHREQIKTWLPVVTVSTIHRAKGLEFSVVCVADLGRAPWRSAPWAG